MKILYVTDSLAAWGGIERVLSDKMNCLVQEYGYDVYVVTADQANHPIPFPLDNRIHLKDLNIRFHQQYKQKGFKRLQKYRELERLYKERLKLYIAEIKPDIISCIRDGYASSVLDIKVNVPIIFESHSLFRELEFEEPTILHRIVINYKRRKLKRLNGIVALTWGDAHDWESICENVFVIPNIVHLNKSGRYSSCDNKRAIFVGRFEKQKDFGAMVEIWSSVQNRHPDWILNVYGNGELKPYFENIVKEKNLNINIHSAVSDIMDRYRDSSILVMSSLYEPFGLVLPEAMSCGIPVVAFDCPYGPPDLINDGVDGFLIGERNIEAFANRVCQLIEDDTLRKQMGKAAIISAQKYNKESVMPLWNDLFIQLFNTSK